MVIATQPPPSSGSKVLKKKKKRRNTKNGGFSVGRWNAAEHRMFLKGLRLHGREWKKVATMIRTRSSAQIRSHAQKYFAKLKKEREDDDDNSIEDENRARGAMKHMRRSPSVDAFRRPFSPNTVNVGAGLSESSDAAVPGVDMDVTESSLELEQVESKLLNLLSCRRELVTAWFPKEDSGLEYTMEQFSEQIDIVDRDILSAYASALHLKCAKGHVRAVAKALLSFIVPNQAVYPTMHSKKLSDIATRIATLPKGCVDVKAYLPKLIGERKKLFKPLTGQRLTSKGSRMTLLRAQCSALIEDGNDDVRVSGMDASEVVALEVLSNQCTPTNAPVKLSPQTKSAMPSLSI